jgi:WD40 repeat protein
MKQYTLNRLALFFFVLCWLGAVQVRGELPLPVATLERSTPVDYATEVFPLLQKNCLACHHQKKAEGGLVLEKLDAIRTGGDSGAGVTASDLAASSIWLRASGNEEPLMPPEDNTVGASPLKPEELALLKLWIEQGATGVDAPTSGPIDWQPIPETIRATYALDVSPDGRTVVFARANRVYVADLATGKVITQLADPNLKPSEIADVDLVQSIAFSPSGDYVATGGYRTVRLWRKSNERVTFQQNAIANAGGLVRSNDDDSLVALVNEIGDIEIHETATGKKRHSLIGHRRTIVGMAWASAAGRLIVIDESGQVELWDATTGTSVAQQDLAKVASKIAISRDGTWIVVLTGNRTVDLLQTVTNESGTSLQLVQEQLNGTADANEIAVVSAPAPVVAIASESGGVILVSAPEKTVVRQLNHESVVDAMAVSNDDSMLITGGRNGQAKVWNMADGALKVTLAGASSVKLAFARAARDAARQTAFIAALNAKTATLDELLKKEEESLKKTIEARDMAATRVAEREKKRAEAVALVAATEKLSTDAMATMSEAETMMPAATKTVEVTGMLVTKLTSDIDGLEKMLAQKKEEKLKADQTLAKAKADIEMATKMMTDSKAIVEKAKQDLEAQKKAAAAAEEEKKKSDMDLVNRQQAVDAATAAKQLATDAIPHHQASIAAATRDQMILDQQVAQWKDRQAAPENQIVSVDIDASGTRVITLHRDGSARGYRTGDGTSILELSEPRASFSQISMVGDLVIRSNYRGLVRCDRATETWQLERTIGSPLGGPLADRVTAIDFHRNGQTIAVGGGVASRSGDVKIFSVQTGDMIRDFGDVHSDSVFDLAYSPDGLTLASAAADRTIRLLDVAAGKLTRTLEGHTHHVLSIAWNDNNQTLVSGSADLNLKVWDTKTGEVSRTVTGFPKEITSVQFVGTTSQVVAAIASGQVRLVETSNGGTVRNYDAGGSFLFTAAVNPDGSRVLAAGDNGVVQVWNLADAASIAKWE